MTYQDSVVQPKHVIRLRGFSLIELMISMIMGLILISGMISFFSALNRSSALNRAIAIVQEDARFALESISADIRMAGFQGCSTMDESRLKVKAVNAPIANFSTGISESAIWLSKVESETQWTPEIPWGSSFSLPSVNSAVTGTYALALQFGDPSTYPLKAQVGILAPAADGLIQIAGERADININSGDLAIISDCQGGDLFHVTSVSEDDDTGAVEISHFMDAVTNNDASFSVKYGSTDILLNQTMVMRFNANIYYIGDTGQEDASGNSLTALYLQTYPFDEDNPPIELIQGAEQLAVSFTQVDALGNVQYVNAGDSTFEPSKVQAVRIGILVSSYDSVAESDDTKTYVMAGQSVIPETAVSTEEASAEDSSDDDTADDDSSDDDSADDDSATSLTHAADRKLRLAFDTTVKIRNQRAQE